MGFLGRFFDGAVSGSFLGDFLMEGGLVFFD